MRWRCGRHRRLYLGTRDDARHFRGVVLSEEHVKAVDDFEERAVRYLHLSIKPLFVFDGRRLPGKGMTDADRRRKRAAAQAHIESALSPEQLQQVMDGALELELEDSVLKAAAGVTDKFVTDVIHRLRKLGIPYIKAPYEADAQLAALDRLKITQFSQSEDGDLIIYGIKNVLLKNNYHLMTADLYTQSNLLNNNLTTRSVPLLKLLRDKGLKIKAWYAVLGRAGGGGRWPSLSWLRSHYLPICAPLADQELSSQVIGHCDYLHMPG
jgi:hypothetical protein